MFLHTTFARLTLLTKFAVIVTSASSCLMADEAKVASVVSGPAPLVLGDASLTAGLPGKGDRVDLVVHPPVPLAVGDIEPSLLAIEAAVRVQHDPAWALIPGGVMGGHRVEHFVQLGR